MQEFKIGFDPNNMNQGLKSMLVSISWHSTKPHVPTYFQYIFANINHTSIPTQARYSTNQDDGCLSCGKDCFAFNLGCACTKQGSGDFARYTKGLLKKMYIDQVI